MRGAHFWCHCGLLRLGLIPARAGSTPVNISPRWAPRAHPRPCGEHSESEASGHHYAGSSPPVRGALNRNEISTGIPGLIPARAGSTSALAVGGNACRAHPRPCGEHRPQTARQAAYAGSSPPVRGAHSANPFGPARTGLIPARAGSTSSCSFCSRSAWAHPRPCGEHSVFSA